MPDGILTEDSQPQAEQLDWDSDTGATQEGLSGWDGGGATSEEEAQVGQAEQSGTGFDPNRLPPELQQIYKSMQADYTRKTQALAEKERQFAWALELQQLAQTNPQAARDMLMTIANHLGGGTSQPQEQSPLTPPEDLEYESEAVKRLWDMNQQLTQELQQMRQLLGATVQHALSEEVQKQLEDIEREFGKFDKAALIEEAKKRPYMSLREVFIVTNFPKLAQQARQSAYNTQTVKRAANPIAAASPAKESSKVSSLQEAFELALRDLGYSG